MEKTHVYKAAWSLQRISLPPGPLTLSVCPAVKQINSLCVEEERRRRRRRRRRRVGWLSTVFKHPNRTRAQNPSQLSLWSDRLVPHGPVQPGAQTNFLFCLSIPLTSSSAVNLAGRVKLSVRWSRRSRQSFVGRRRAPRVW